MFNLSLSRQTPSRPTVFAWTLLLLAGISCNSASNNDNAGSNGIIVINAPATGKVTLILTAEGIHINKGAPVVEIAVQSTVAPASRPGESVEAQAVRNYQSADAEIEAARTEAVRHEAEVQRLTPLVASGEVSQGQLDGERALYEGAQRRLQQAQDAKRRAESGLLAARQPGLNQGTTPAAQAQIVSAVATSAGTVAVINTRVGDQVKAGEPLATLRADP